MIERCRSWIQSALEELASCPSAHNVSLKEGEALLTELETVLHKTNFNRMMKADLLKSAEMLPQPLEALAHRCEDLDRALSMSRVDVEEARAARDAMRNRLNEIEGALNVVGTAFESFDRLLAAAERIEG